AYRRMLRIRQRQEIDSIAHDGPAAPVFPAERELEHRLFPPAANGNAPHAVFLLLARRDVPFLLLLAIIEVSIRRLEGVPSSVRRHLHGRASLRGDLPDL